MIPTVGPTQRFTTFQPHIENGRISRAHVPSHNDITSGGRGAKKMSNHGWVVNFTRHPVPWCICRGSFSVVLEAVEKLWNPSCLIFLKAFLTGSIPHHLLWQLALHPVKQVVCGFVSSEPRKNVQGTHVTYLFATLATCISANYAWRIMETCLNWYEFSARV